MADSGAQGTAVAAVPNLPIWEADARDRVQGGIKKFSKPLAEFLARDANEGDTRLLVTDFLCEALGYDRFADLTTEAPPDRRPLEDEANHCSQGHRPDSHLACGRDSGPQGTRPPGLAGYGCGSG